ncbi:MAG: ribonuclease III [Flavobacteriales bacterium]|nr:ribonuclease III [Flavobacteriales bacterium]
MSRKGLIRNLFRKKENKEFSSKLKKLLGIYPINLKLYHQAFMHNSAVTQKASEKNSNERLEFLGDAVIDLVVAEFVFKKFSGKGEGYLTEMRSKIVSREQLSNIARKLSIEQYLTVNHSMRNSRNTNLYGIAGNALEALVGAIYLDHGYRIARKFIIYKLIKPYIDIDQLDAIHVNFKSILLQWGQKYKKQVEFKLEKTVFDRKDKLFNIGVYIDNILLIDALHQTKKKAEQTAAEKAIESLEIDMSEFKLSR